MEPAAFRQRVGQRLGIVPAAASLSAEDDALVSEAYKSLMGELTEHGLCMWGPETVPTQYADALIGMTAAMLVDEFGISEPRRSQLIATHAFGLPVASPGERRLRAMVRIESNDDSEPEFY
jgi:hypothetical protein